MSSSSAAPTEKPIRVGEALRAGAVMLGGPAVLLGTGVRSGLASLRAVRRGHRPTPHALACLAAAAYMAAVRPWMRNWGATESEATASLPGDEDVPDPAGQTTRAVTIDAPVDEVWPWIAQLGQDRGGFYSYEWLENLAGCKMRNADRIHPEWQQREVGELVMLHPANGLDVTRFEPGRAFGLEGWGTWVLESTTEGGTRLSRARPAPSRPCTRPLLQPLPRASALPDGAADAAGRQAACGGRVISPRRGGSGRAR